MLNSFTEVVKETAKSLEKSLLGKKSEIKSLDTNVKQYDQPLFSVRNCPKDGDLGHWEGERGNSKFKFNEEHIPAETRGNTRANEDGLSMGELSQKYKLDDGIPFKEGEPNFNEVSKGNVEIKDFSDSRTDNFDKADIELAKQKGCQPGEVKSWRKENNYTWHECRDMQTMQKLPNEIHANVPHSGGISQLKRGM